MVHQILSALFALVSGHGYILLFIAIFIEGPLATAAGAFASTLGVFDPLAVLVLSFVGNIIPDVLYYWLGYWGRENLIEKYGHYFRLTPEKIEKLEKLYHEHAVKTLMAVKMLPTAGLPGLIIAGVVRIPVKKYILWSGIVTILSSVAYWLIGYYSGAAYSKTIRFIDLGGYAILGVIIISAIFIYLNRKASEWISERIQD